MDSESITEKWQVNGTLADEWLATEPCIVVPFAGLDNEELTLVRRQMEENTGFVMAQRMPKR